MEIRRLSQNQLARLLVLLNEEATKAGVKAFYQMDERNGAMINGLGVDVMLHEDSMYMVMDFGRIASIGFNDIVRSLDLTYSQYASKGNKMVVQMF